MKGEIMTAAGSSETSTNIYGATKGLRNILLPAGDIK